MKSIFYPIYVFLAIVILLSGCEKTKQVMGQTKEGPDEFSVFQRAPLSLPPDYQLKPPKPGSERPQSVNPRDRAIQALGANKFKTHHQNLTKKDLSNLSRGELTVLQLTGATQADPSIRIKIEEETSILITESKSLTDKIAFWQSPHKFGTVIDPAKETKRIRRNQALGTPLNKGDIPVITRKQKAIFQDVFR
ncbi:MAG: DUF3035 domain-containing protein [Pseudomonadota bacterium]|nr:DUF3035 domain-containing protein [Pseudomonadota bacterium]